MPTTGPHVLLVEDDDMLRLSLSQVLLRAGYSVDAVACGEHATELLSSREGRGSFDVVLTDMRLGDLDGATVLRHTRTLPCPPEVIIITGHGTLQTAIESLRAGAFDYLLKPCHPEDLLRCIGSAAQRRSERRS
jgi:DNA-binding NtrC family response regulator